MALLFHLYFLVGSGSGYRYDSNAFLFSLVNKPGWAPVKLPQTGKYSSRRQYSIYKNPSYGPAFGGGHDIYISNYASSNRNSGPYVQPTERVQLPQHLRQNIPGRNIQFHTRRNRNVLRNNLNNYNELLPVFMFK